MAEPTDRNGPTDGPADGPTGPIGAPGVDPDIESVAPADPERRHRLHEANNRLAAVIMNVAFARATLSACPADEHLTPLERSDLATALEHAEDAANQLAIVVRLLG